MQFRFISFFKKIKNSNSLQIKIGLLYLLLATVNTIYFSVMIFENQMDLIVNNFSFQSDKLLNSLSIELENVGEVKDKKELYRNINAILRSNGVDQFAILDSNGNSIYVHPDDLSSHLILPSNLKDRISDLNSKVIYMRSRYHFELDKDNFVVQFLFPIEKAEIHESYLYAQLSVKMIQDRLILLYIQIFMAIGWGLIFHTAFGYYVYRKFFKRMDILSYASQMMASGRLETRVSWDESNVDELDRLGMNFNRMAENIEDSVKKILQINRDIYKELSIGKQVQAMTLPVHSLIQEYSPAIHYRAMREVNGDIYNFFRINDKTQIIFIADATGHGISAGLVTIAIQMSLNAIIDKTHEPKDIMDHLSKILLDVFDSYFMASGVCILIEDYRRITFVNAAHNPPILYSKNESKLYDLTPNRNLLGMSKSSFTETTIMSVNSGDKLLLYTDGLIESTDKNGKMYGSERLQEIFMNNIASSNEEISNLIQKDYNEFINVQTDDVTFIILEIPANVQ
ncbi:SpoIIE family protein phosphatase [Leptospira sp. GIMC2001]|uniref:SpoIIE family protein phosphatase n=1 Tax=Leptospira sp. GIMC2001 TaxID=1513297 RepID=UPI002349B27D|nr:SpoIIE family protein phosphatase [Leptospira sp. GIMC2001]WCL49035.1 SpoIIE family protein phosphatase [Leptospira sp. GIMC2001]